MLTVVVNQRNLEAGLGKALDPIMDQHPSLPGATTQHGFTTLRDRERFQRKGERGEEVH